MSPFCKWSQWKDTFSLKICDAKNLQKQRVRGRTAVCQGGAAEGLLGDLREDLKWLPVLDDLVREPELGWGWQQCRKLPSHPNKLNSFDNVSFVIHASTVCVRARSVCVCERAQCEDASAHTVQSYYFGLLRNTSCQ
jgi:hypothetical protein